MAKRKNSFTKAIKHLKSTEIDEKIAVLEAAPTNNTTFLNVPDSTMDTEQAQDGSFDLDLDQDASSTDTTGLFLADGTIKTVEPPINIDTVLPKSLFEDLGDNLIFSLTVYLIPSSSVFK